MSFPSVGRPEREQAIIDLVKADQARFEWSVITSTHGNHTGEFYVFSDALKIPVDVDNRVQLVRANVSAATQQLIADHLGCYMLTAKLADLIWLQRQVTLPPFPRQITNTTDAMIKHSCQIDEALARLGRSGLVCTTGKHWIIDNDTLAHPNAACNYGWHFVGQSFQGIRGEVCAGLMKDEKGTYMRLIQGRGWAHNIHHSDYSQVCVLVSRPCFVDGKAMNFDEVASDPELSYLVNYSGILRCLRQPGV